MRIPVVTLKFDEYGYEGYFAEVPRSVKEGFVHELSNLGTDEPEGETNTQRQKRQADQGRAVNIKLLGLVRSWNLDDDDGNPLPLVSSFESEKDKKKRLELQGAVVAEVPVEIILAISEKVTQTARVSDRVKDFSSASSAAR